MLDPKLHTRTHADPEVEVAYDLDAIREWALWRVECDSWQTEWDFPVPDQRTQEMQVCMALLNVLDEIEKLKTERASAPEGCTCAKPLLVGALLRAYPARDYGPEHDPGCPASTD